MPPQARIARTSITRRRLLLAGMVWPAGRGVSAEALLVRLDGDRLRVAAPQLRFLTGKPLERLRNGASVAFDAQLALLRERHGTVAERAVERFLFSYDIWEEKFAVARTQRPARSASHLSSTAAEAWCLENLSLPTGGLAPDQPFWLRLELRAEDPRDRPSVVGEPGISLTRLIELFSRPSRGQQAPSVVEDGPFRLADLNKGRGSGAG